jgi:hypothetical protein
MDLLDVRGAVSLQPPDCDEGPVRYNYWMGRLHCRGASEGEVMQSKVTALPECEATACKAILSRAWPVTVDSCLPATRLTG